MEMGDDHESWNAAQAAAGARGYSLPDPSLLSHPPHFSWRRRPTWKAVIPGETDSLPVNCEEGVKFCSGLFEGVANLWVADVPSSPSDGRLEGNYTLFTVQGRFKKEGLSFDDVVSGMEFQRPIVNVPGAWIVNSAFAIGKTIRPMSDFGDLDDPYMRTPVICAGTVQIAPFEGAEDGNDAEESATPGTKRCAPRMVEDCSILGEDFIDPETGGPIPREKRKEKFYTPEMRKAMHFETDKVYTFTFFQQYMDMAQLQFNLGMGLAFDMATHLDGQPFPIQCKLRSGEPLWDFELWHELLMKDAILHWSSLPPADAQ